jgi:hypothetical protein
MAKNQDTYKAILAEVARGGERSSLFWWFVEHHDELIEQAVGKRMRWGPLSARFAEHGLTDVRGLPASPRTARETWLRARRVVAQAKARKQALAETAAARPGSTPPSRISPDWRPQEVVAPPPTRPAHPVPALSGTGGSLTDYDESKLTPEQREHIARANESLNRQFERADRRFRLGGG